jgi:hypothetical protein
MRRTLVITICGLGLLAPAGALASGGPIPPLQGAAGLASPKGDRFVAIGAAGQTIVERVTSAGRLVARSAGIPGGFGVPRVALDGSTSGLSADGRTLVLERVSRDYPPPRTGLLVLDAARLRPRASIDLSGAYSVDAISPDGRWLYLVHYPSLSNVLEYEVRAYDMQRHTLLQKPVIDRREPDEAMTGQPVTRTMSPDGRWAYTLYDRSPKAPFIHALDTRNLAARCIDLPSLQGSAGVFDMKLSLSGGSLRVLSDRTPVALVNTTTFTVRVPGVTRTRPASHASGEGGGGFPWELAALPVAAALVTLAVVTRRRRNMGSMPV